MSFILRLFIIAAALSVGSSAVMAQPVSLNDLARAQCVYVQTLDGTRYRAGPNCPEGLDRVRDCISLDVPGNGRRVPGVGVVRDGEPVQLGRDCAEEVPPGRLVGAPPTITDTTVPWMTSDADNVFSAKVDAGENHTINSVFLRQTRHYWPGRNEAHYLPATLSADGESYTAQPPAQGTWMRADHVFYEWTVTYTSDVTGDSGTARSTSGAEPHGFVYQCDADQQALTLSQIVAAAVIYNDDPRTNASHPFPSHLLPAISLEDQGMPYGTGAAVLELTSVSLTRPSLLQFVPGHPDEADERRYSDARLAGLAFGQLYNTGARRPALGCIPSSEWFVHEAGWHRFDGGMTLLIIEEPVPGMMPGPIMAVGPGVFHPRVWDLHVWLPADGQPATLSIDSPVPIEGLSMADRVFFRPETFE